MRSWIDFPEVTAFWLGLLKGVHVAILSRGKSPSPQGLSGGLGFLEGIWWVYVSVLAPWAAAGPHRIAEHWN